MKAVALIVALVATLFAATLACAAPPAPLQGWPARLDVGVNVASRSSARVQLMGEAYGTNKNGLIIRVGGWLANGSEGTKGYLSNAYVGLDRPRYYVAAGQKFVVFGPAGLMVSPGARGGEVILKGAPISLQLLGGKTQFTPPTGTAGRFTPNTDPIFGERRPRKTFFAARAEYDLSADQRRYIGLNALWLDNKAGASLDYEGPWGANKVLYGELSSFDGATAALGGVRFPDLKEFFHTDRATTLDVFWLTVPDDYQPAAFAASQYYPDRTGLGIGLSHQISSRSEVGLYGDSHGVLLNFQRHFILDK